MGEFSISAAALTTITALIVSLAGVVGLLYRSMISQYEARLREHKEAIAAQLVQINEQRVQIKEQTVALNRLSEVVESWTPDRQQRRSRQG